jgi:hypothetical protein
MTQHLSRTWEQMMSLIKIHREEEKENLHGFSQMTIVQTNTLWWLQRQCGVSYDIQIIELLAKLYPSLARTHDDTPAFSHVITPTE